MAGAGYKVFNAGDILTSSDVNTYLQQQVVMVFNDAAARTTALTSVLAEGMVTYLKDTNTVEVYDGSAWVSTTGDITGITAGTGITVTNPTSATPTVSIDTAVVPRLANANTFTTGAQTIQTGGTGNVGLIVQAHLAGGQTANLQEWRDSSGTVLSSFDQFGRLRVRSTTTSAFSAAIEAASAATVGLLVKGAASQTANLTEWQNNAGVVGAYVSSGGNVAGANLITGRFLVDITNGLPYLDFSSNTLTVLNRAITQVNFVVKGIASQTADMQQWQNSAGTVITSIGAGGAYTSTSTVGVSGRATFGSTTVSTLAHLTVFTTSASRVGQVIQGAASQTANLQEWQNSAGTVLASVNKNGEGFFSIKLSVQGDFGAALNVNPYTASQTGLIIRGYASQTANLQEWQNSSGTVLANVSSSGNITGAGFLTGTSYVVIGEQNSGGSLRMTKQTAAGTNPGADIARLYFRDGTTAGTLKLVVRAGAAGAETTILDNIPQ